MQQFEGIYKTIDEEWEKEEISPIPPGMINEYEQTLTELRNWIMKEGANPYESGTFKIMLFGALLSINFLAFLTGIHEEVDLEADYVGDFMLGVIKRMHTELVK